MAESARVLAEGGRLVVAGLYVESSSPFLRLLAWLVNGGDVRRAVSRFEDAATGAGFTISVSVTSGKGFRLPVFVLGRTPAPGEAASQGTLGPSVGDGLG